MKVKANVDYEFEREGSSMKITKRNGFTTLYDDEKIIRSILQANAEVPEESLNRQEASAIADEVFRRLTEQFEIITTQEVRACVCELLQERALPLTAEHYMDFHK